MISKHSAQPFQAQVVGEPLKDDTSFVPLAVEHGVHPIHLITWRATALEGLSSLSSLVTRQDSPAALPADDEARLAEYTQRLAV
jgi:hypothetical protein